MGDRANVLVRCVDEQVCLYTHWGGSELPKILQHALKRGIRRWHDFPYLARIIFSEMIKDDIMDEAGYGISQRVGDGESRVLTVSVPSQIITNPGGHYMSFQDYVNCEDISWHYETKKAPPVYKAEPASTLTRKILMK